MLLLWLALATASVGAATAEAGVDGAVSPTRAGGGEKTEACVTGEFGSRTLRLGDCGRDVKVLHWILRAIDFDVSLDERFAGRTEDAVRSFERQKSLGVDGVVEDETRHGLVTSLRRDQASWYGPGFWGNKTACGQTFKRDTLGVAHRRLPCGTKVVIGRKGKWVRTKVIDRGPFAKRGYTRDWDLSQRTARRIGLDEVGVGRVRVGVVG